ncbi:hypothetical protein ABPG75_012062 [Micractinium tetrahymenae]
MPPRVSACRGQAMDLLGQAALLEAFVNKQQRSSREATARAAWLVQQQELAQEEAECEAAWAACCAARLVPGDAAEEDNAPEASLRAALEAADGCVGEALVAAAAVASLLGGHRPPPSSSVGSSAALHQQLRAATARLRQAMAAVDAALLQQGKPRASAAGSRSSECGASSGDLAEQDGSADCTDDGTLDGWPAGEHAVFTHARRASLAPGGGGEAALVRRLAAALPSRSSEAVLAHERWHKEASLLQAALQQLEAGWHEEQVALLGAAAALLGEAEAAALAERTAAKQAARQQAEAARQAAEARREAALEALRLQAAPAAQRDAARATGPTQSSAAALSAGQAQHGLFAGAMAGLTSEQVLRDQRFKVYEALLQLGLHTTAAGRQAVAAARPARQPRPDTLTSLQRQGLAG